MSNDVPIPSTRISLLCRLRNSADTASWDLFVRTYGMAMYQFCLRRGLQDSDAVDVVQEVLAQVVVSLPSFTYDPARGRFRDWLGAVLRSKLSKHWKASNRPDQTNLVGDLDHFADAGVDPEWTCELYGRLLQVAMQSIRDRFTETNWLVFERTWLNQESADGIAAEYGISIAQVYVARSRIAKRLVEEVQMLSEDVTWLAGPK